MSAPAGYGKTATLASWAAAQPRSAGVVVVRSVRRRADPVHVLPAVGDLGDVARRGRRRVRAARPRRRRHLRLGGRRGQRAGHGRRARGDRRRRPPPGGAGPGDADGVHRRAARRASASSPAPGRIRRCRSPGCGCAASCSSCAATTCASAPPRCPTSSSSTTSPLDGDELVRLHDLTEGWPAGAQLAAIALQGGVGRDDFLDAFATTDRAVGDFLLSEVLASLPPELVEFLVETSVLDAFDAELCAAVTGVDDAGGGARTPDRGQPVRRPAGRPGPLVPLPPPVRRVPAGPAGVARELPARGRPTTGRAGRSRSAATSPARSATRWPTGDVERAGQVVRGAARPFDEHVGGRRRRRSGPCGCGCTSSERRSSRPTRTWVVEFLIGLITLAGADDVPSWLERVRRAHPDADGELDRPHRGGVGRAPPAPGPAAGGDPPASAPAMAAVGGTPAEPRPAPAPPHRRRPAPTSRPASWTRRGAVIDHALGQPGRQPGGRRRAPSGASPRTSPRSPASCPRAEELAADAAQIGATGSGSADHEPGRDLRRPGARRGAPRARRARPGRAQVLDEVKQGERGEPPPHAPEPGRPAPRQDGPGARRRGRRRMRCSRRPGCPTPSPTPRSARCSARRPPPRPCGSIRRERAALIDRARSGPRRDTGAARPPGARSSTTAAPPRRSSTSSPPPTTRRARVERSVLCALSVLERDVELANDHLARGPVAAASPNG